MKEFSRHKHVVQKSESIFGMPIQTWARNLNLGGYATPAAKATLRDKLTEALTKTPHKNDQDVRASRMASQFLHEMLSQYPDHQEIHNNFKDFADHYFDMQSESPDLTDIETKGLELAQHLVNNHYTPGNTDNGPFSYRLALHVGPETLLDWDKPLNDHHDDAKSKILQAFPDHNKPSDDYQKNVGTWYGSGIYQHLSGGGSHGSNLAASKALYNAGIHGIRYLDNHSRMLPTHDELYFDGEKIEPYDGSNSAHVDRAKLLDTDNERWYQSSNLAARIKAFPERYNGLTVKALAKKLQNEAVASERKTGRGSHLWDYVNHLKTYGNRFELRPNAAKPTYNYVIFHPDFIEALAQYNIKGDKIRDYGPGVHLKAVEHDPFKDEDR